MLFNAKVKYIRYSPYKLRPLVDIVRGKSVKYALSWLAVYPVKRIEPIKKMIESAAANAKHLNNIDVANLVIKEIRVDQGPIFRYFKPGAMGRSTIRRKRFSHMNVILETTEKKEI